MATDDDRRPPDPAPNGGRGTALLVVQVVVAVASALALLGGVGLIVPCALWLVDLERQPRQPPGQIVALIPMAGAAVGAALGLLGVAGLALVVFSRWLAGRRR